MKLREFLEDMKERKLLIRFWTMDIKEEECMFGYIRQVLTNGNEDNVVGVMISSCDYDEEDFGYFYRWDEMSTLTYFPSDAER